MSEQTETAEIKVFEAKIGLITKLIAGFAFIAGGAKVVQYSLHKEDHYLVWVGIGIAVFGAWLLPSLGDQISKIYITIFPNGLPILGGRRATDPQPPAPTPPPADDLGKIQ